MLCRRRLGSATPMTAELPDERGCDALVLSGVKKSFGGVEALPGASLTCERGEVHALIGENGAGKSTLIKVLAGAIRADAGDDLPLRRAACACARRSTRRRPAS